VPAGTDGSSYLNPGTVNDCLMAGSGQFLPWQDHVRVSPDNFLVPFVHPGPVFLVSAGLRSDTPQGISAMNNQFCGLVFRGVALIQCCDACQIGSR
jgi:hypothetical protein